MSAERELPKATALLAAFEGEVAAGVVPAIAGLLAEQHDAQWQAETVSRDPDADDHVVARSKRAIDELNARRVRLVADIDGWVAEQAAGGADATLHTETLGSVVDRLAIAWVRTRRLARDGAHDRARLAADQLAQLAAAYDELVRDVSQGRRRLPAWHALKSYREGGGTDGRR